MTKTEKATKEQRDKEDRGYRGIKSSKYPISSI
jgi:hypothetical protein